VGYVASKQELVSIIRRIDTDGDAKINVNEFGEGIKSQFS
jgi:Ca2+-binding EF-hand superfamily protein